jgi:regulator of sigma D
MSLELAIGIVCFIIGHVFVVVMQARSKTERIYMNASSIPDFCKDEVLYTSAGHVGGTVLRKITHTSVSDSCITVRPLHWWERLLHWLRRCL